MPRIQNRFRSPADLELTCPVDGCGRTCRTHSGLTQHIHAKHKDYQPGTPRSAATVDDLVVLDSDSDLDLSSAAGSEMSIPPSAAGTWDAFSYSRDSVGQNFEIPEPFLPSSRPDSPSQESLASDSESSIFTTEYHPLINGP